MADASDVVEGLLASAVEDADAARLMTEIEVADRIVGFHAQQAAEKFLKAVLAQATGEYPRTHDLERLAAVLAGSGIELPIPLDDLVLLTPWAVDRRYPDPFEPESLDADWAIAMLRDLRRWAEHHVRR